MSLENTRRIAKPQPKVPITCKGCGKTFEIYHSEAKRGVRQWCSRKCWSESTTHHRICAHCGKNFTIKSSRITNVGDAKYCSRDCHYAACDNRTNCIKNPSRFWDNVDKNGPIPPHMPHLGPCWLWTAGKADGYGSLRDRNRNRRAHRISYEISFGDPGEFFVCHHCDNPSCVNPSHLFLGTTQENTADMMKKGRHAVGEAMHNTKINESQAREIFALYHSSMSSQKIAEKFGISRSQVDNIGHKVAWRHIHDTNLLIP